MKPVKTAKGVFLDLSKSDIISISPSGEEYPFSSYKKQEMFIKRLHKELAGIDIVYARVGGSKENYQKLVENAYKKVYDGMIQK